MSDRANEQVFPCAGSLESYEWIGLTKRELFAWGLMCANVIGFKLSVRSAVAATELRKERGLADVLPILAESAVNHADALLAELDKPQETAK